MTPSIIYDKDAIYIYYLDSIKMLLPLFNYELKKLKWHLNNLNLPHHL